MNKLFITCLVLLFVIIVIISQKLPVVSIGLIIPLVLSVTGVVPATDAFKNLGSTTTFLIIGALVIGDACFRTGLTDLIGHKVIQYTGRFQNESVKLLLISLLAATMSAFLSSFGVQVALLSLIIVMSQVLQISKTRALIALGYSATIGGMWSIIGTTLMVMAKSAYMEAVPGETIGMFEITKASFPVGIVSILLYCFITSRYQPDRGVTDENVMETQEECAGTEVEYSRRDQIIVAITFIAFIVLVALDGYTPIPANMVTVLVLLVFGATKISTVSQIVNCINWDTILYIVGITLLSDAMVSSGLSEYIGSFLINLTGCVKNEYVILTVICIVSAVLTQLMSNSGAFSVVLPFLPVIAQSLHVSLKPLIIATAISCSCGFCLPLAAPSYLMLAAEGKIEVMDWMKQGVPILIVAVILTILLVPVFWPLY